MCKLLFVTCLLCVFHLARCITIFNITTFSGGGIGDNGPAKNAVLSYPKSLAYRSGEMLIATENRIRKVFSNGTITTIAGTGVAGFSGDGGLAVNAKLNNPVKVRFAPNGDVLIADMNNHRIRRVFTNGTIITIAGTGSAGFSGDGGLATSAQLNGPYGMCASSTEVYIADRNNMRIRKIDANGTISTIIGGGSDYLIDTSPALNVIPWSPTGVAFDMNGNLVFSETNHITKYVYPNVTVIGGTTASCIGSSTNAPWNTPICQPNDLTVFNEKIYFAESHLVRYLVRTEGSLLGGSLTQIVGNNIIYSPLDVGVASNDKFYVADWSNHRIWESAVIYGSSNNYAGTGRLEFGGDGGKDARYQALTFVTFSPSGDLIVSDTANHVVRKVTSEGLVSTIAGKTVPGETYQGFSGDNALATSAMFNEPRGVAVSKSGEVFICDSSNHRIRKIGLDGIVKTIAGNGGAGFDGDGGLASVATLNSPIGISIATGGDIYFSDSGNHRVRKIFSNGTIVTFVGKGTNGFSGDGEMAKDASLSYPYGIFVTESNELLIADKDNHRIRKVFENGTITTISGTETSGFSGDGGLATNAQLNQPSDVILAWNGDIYFTDSSNHRVRKISASGIITTVAGSSSGFSGDNSIATSGQLSNPTGLAISSTGEIFIGDSGNSRIRKLTPSFTCFGRNAVDTCSGWKRGICVEEDTCSCEEHYFGTECQITTCSGIQSNSTQVCSQHGNCTNYNNCLCNNGYYGNNCEFYNCSNVRNDDPSVCSGNGECSSPNSCQCNTNYFGMNCGIATCNQVFSNDSNACSGRGNCFKFNKCNCSFAYEGDFCQVSTCFGIRSNQSNVCSSHGVCLDSNICQCDLNYNGTNCNSTQCNGISNVNSTVCSSRGNCSSFNTCTCENGYYGMNCQEFDCFGLNLKNSSVCSGNGTCVNKNTCVCKDGYTGNECQYAVCYGVPSNNATVCSSRGKCHSPNRCLCDTQFGGQECELHKCYGLLETDIHVCGGKGTCLDVDTCTCVDDTVGGPNCDVVKCFGLLATDTKVCNHGNGICNAPNTCSCSTLNWFGPSCNVTKCFEIDSSENEVCNNKGSCVGPNICSCSNASEYWGMNCNQTFCDGISSLDSNVCGGHGKCLEFGVCLCEENFFSNQCDLLFITSKYLSLSLNNSWAKANESVSLRFSIMHPLFTAHYTQKNVKVKLTYNATLSVTISDKSIPPGSDFIEVTIPSFRQADNITITAQLFIENIVISDSMHTHLTILDVQEAKLVETSKYVVNDMTGAIVGGVVGGVTAVLVTVSVVGVVSGLVVVMMRKKAALSTAQMVKAKNIDIELLEGF